MPRWVLNCPQCLTDFTHSEFVKDSTLEDYYLPAKPEFPTGGLNAECPNCKKTSMFQQYQLVFRED